MAFTLALCPQNLRNCSYHIETHSTVSLLHSRPERPGLELFMRYPVSKRGRTKRHSVNVLQYGVHLSRLSDGLPTTDSLESLPYHSMCVGYFFLFQQNTTIWSRCSRVSILPCMHPGFLSVRDLVTVYCYYSPRKGSLTTELFAINNSR